MESESIFIFKLNGAEVPAELDLTEILTSTEETSFDLARACSVLYFWINTADKIIKGYQREKRGTLKKSNQFEFSSTQLPSK
jgi:hypothetical protein